jgi:WD40 repeat protein
MPEQIDPREPQPRLAYSPDGKYLVLMPARGGLEVWDGSVKALLANLDKSNSVILAAGFDRDSHTLWACREDGQVSSWSLPDFRQGISWKVPGREGTQRGTAAARLKTAAFTADAGRVATGDESGRVILYQGRGERLGELSLAPRPVQSLAWSSDGQLIAVGAGDGDVNIWRVADAFRLHQFPSFGSGFSNLLFSPDDRWLLVAQRNGGGKTWDVDSGNQILSGFLGAGAWPRLKGRLACSSVSEAAYCELLAPEVIRPLTGHHASICKLSWGLDSRHLVSLDARFTVRVWNIDRSRPLAIFDAPQGLFTGGNAGVALSDDARLVAYVNGGESQALIWELGTGKILDKWLLPRGFERLAPLDGGRFLLVREEETAAQSEKWQTVARILEIGKPADVTHVIRPHAAGDTRRFLNSILTPDGRNYLWLGPRLPPENRRVEVRDVATGRQIGQINLPQNSEADTLTANLSPDGRMLHLWQSGSHSSWLYDLCTNSLPESLNISLLAMSTDSRWLAGHMPHGQPGIAIRPRSAATDWVFLPSGDLDPVNVAAFSPDGQYLAWGSESGVITVADLNALGDEIRKFEAEVLPQ